MIDNNLSINNILITGKPGSGKTTLFKRLVKKLKPLQPVGFYTQEIREDEVRKGFALNGLDGRTGVLAHVDLPGHYRVGRYGVDVAGFENFISRVPFSDPGTPLVMIDEIGKMECFSQKFRDIISAMLHSDRIFVATVALKGSGLIAEIKQRSDIHLFETTRSNQDIIITKILDRVNLDS